MQSTTASQDTRVFIIAEKFTLGGRHARLCMPTLHATQEETFLLALVNVCLLKRYNKHCTKLSAYIYRT